MTVKTIEVSGIKCRFMTSADVPRIYRRVFRRDIFIDMKELAKQYREYEKTKDANEEFCMPIDSLEIFENIAYVLHKHGDRTQSNSIDEWLTQFDTFDIYQVLPEILEMWQKDQQTTSKSKKKAGK